MENLQNNEPTLFCEVCDGTGKNRGSRCKNCKGFGVAVYTLGKVLYWKRPLSRYSLVLNKTSKYFNIFRISSLLILGLLSWVWAAFYYYQDIKLFNLEINLLNAPKNARLVFFVGCYLFLYSMYRIFAETKRTDEVLRKNYDFEPAEKRFVNSWEEIFEYKRSVRQNVADTFTDEALQVIDKAYEIADKHGAIEILPVHLFSSLLESSRIGNTFIRLGLGPKTISDEVVKQGLLLKPQKKLQIPPKLNKSFFEILMKSYQSAYEMRQGYVSVTELLTSTIDESKELQEILFDLGIDNRKLKNVVAWARIREKLSREYSRVAKAGSHRSTKGMDRAMTAVATPFLNRLSEDVTLHAQFGRLDSCVARDKEIDEIFRVIEGGQNNVLLVGEYGVGRRSIINGIAERMVSGDVPKRLYDKRLVQLHLSSLLSGTTPAGAIERLVMCLNEVARAGNIILYIHNLHELLGVSAGSGDESLDIASALSESLSGGSFLVIASATTESYAQSINNSKLSTVFTRVEIKELEADGAIEVVESKAGYIEYKEKIFFSYDAIEKSVEFARRYLRDVPLPGSAIEIITEAAVQARLKKGIHSLVTNEEVAAVIVEKTHIPLNAVSGDEGQKLMQLESEMHRRVVGQDEAVKLVASALRRARAEIRSQNKPIANFLFLGPTGVGKTELAKTIAEVYFGGEKRMIRLDMSEYQDKSSIYRLIGEPGSKGSGLLTEAIRRQPFGLLLLDEIEKADKDVLNLFLQVMDDGRLTDSTGRVVDFTNVIIIATSNAGTSFVQEQMAAGVDSTIIKDKLLRGELKDYFRPEFLNRFDGIVLFEPISESAIRQITLLMLRRVMKELEEKGVHLEVSDAAVDYFAKLGFDPQFGARPLRRVLQEKVENELAELLLSGRLKRRSTVYIGEGGEISVK